MAKSISGAASQLVNVFVYGTLKQGQPNHYWMTDATAGAPATFVSAGRVVEEYPLVIATRYNVPFLLDKPGTGKLIRGEVYSVDAAKLAHMDVLEQYPEFYTRQTLDIELLAESAQNIGGEKAIPNGTRVQCWVYMLQNFPELMLKKPLLETYTDSAELPYKERSLRVSGPKAKDDLDYEAS